MFLDKDWAACSFDKCEPVQLTDALLFILLIFSQFKSKNNSSASHVKINLAFYILNYKYKWLEISSCGRK